MKESLLDVLMFLFEHFIDDADLIPDRSQLEDKLQDVGFNDVEIENAFDWLDGLNEQQNLPMTASDNTNMRIFNAMELDKIPAESRGYIHKLEREKILSPLAREVAIDRILALNEDDLSVERVKWIILMVLYNQPDQDLDLDDLEDLVFEYPINIKH